MRFHPVSNCAFCSRYPPGPWPQSPCLNLPSPLPSASRCLRRYLGLDRVSKAESEMFDHSCVVIERRLEEFVESELKTDLFLGNADYAVVWR